MAINGYNFSSMTFRPRKATSQPSPLLSRSLVCQPRPAEVENFSLDARLGRGHGLRYSLGASSFEIMALYGLGSRVHCSDLRASSKVSAAWANLHCLIRVLPQSTMVALHASYGIHMYISMMIYKCVWNIGICKYTKTYAQLRLC